MKLVSPDNLSCPLCAAPLAQTDRSVVCSRNHSFDVARQGYVNLLPVQHKKSRDPGDSKSMVAARRRFLDGGTYEPVARELVNQVQNHRPVPESGRLCILDAGCGEGYYLDYLIQALLAPTRQNETSLSAIGLDISKDAIQAAAKRNRALQWIVGTNIRPPVMPESVDCLLCLFGFPSFTHFGPLLRPGGVIVMADPGPDHLIELRRLIYSQVKRSQMMEPTKAHEAGLRLRHTQTLQYRTSDLDQVQIQNLLAMTPHLYRASHEGKLAAARLKKMAVTVEVVFRVFEIAR